MSSEIYELSKRDICDLFLQIDYCLGYNDYKSVINRFSYCQSGCVYLEVLGASDGEGRDNEIAAQDRRPIM